MKSAQSDFENLWRGMERLMTQHKPLSSSAAGGAASQSPGFTSEGIKELLGRIDGALLHVDSGAFQ